MKSLLLVSLLLVGCGDDGPNTVDAAISDAPPSVDAAPDADTVRREGMVILSEVRGNMLDSTAEALFFNGPMYGGPTTVVGECSRYASPNEDGVSAGTLSVTGALVPISLVPSATAPIDYMPADPVPTDLFDANATLTITAPGGTVPAFTGSVTTPAPIAAPVLPASISRATPPTVTWTAGAGEEMWVWLVGLNDGGLTWCRTPDDGSFTVSPAVMALTPAATTSGIMIVWRANATDVTAGAWTVSLTAADAFATDIIPIGP